MKLPARVIITPQALAILCASVFLFAATFSVTFGMRTDEHGNMSDCPFILKQTSVCSMGVIQHIAKWQQLFTATFSKSGDFSFLVPLLLSFIFFAVFVHAPDIFPLALAFSLPILKNKPETKLYNHLVIVFSRGILNPRLYA